MLPEPSYAFVIHIRSFDVYMPNRTMSAPEGGIIIASIIGIIMLHLPAKEYSVVLDLYKSVFIYVRLFAIRYCIRYFDQPEQIRPIICKSYN